MLIRLEEFRQSKLPNATTFCIPPIAVHEVGKLISKPKNRKSMSPDNIPSYLLTFARPYIVDSLMYI